MNPKTLSTSAMGEFIPSVLQGWQLNLSIILSNPVLKHRSLKGLTVQIREWGLEDSQRPPQTSKKVTPAGGQKWVLMLSEVMHLTSDLVETRSTYTTFYITSNWFHNLSELLFPHLQNGASTWNMHSYLEDWRKSRACQALYNWEFLCLLVLSKSGVEFSSIEWNEGSRSHCRMFQAMDRCFSLSLPTRGNTAQRSKWKSSNSLILGIALL